MKADKALSITKRNTKPSVAAKVELELAKEAARKPSKAVVTKPKSPAQLTLPLWAEAVRGVPNAVLRGSLFSINKIRPLAEDRELIATVEGIEIRFTGKRWNQVDLDLFEMILHLSRLQPLGNRVEFTANAILKALGRGTSGKHHQELMDGIHRLSNGTVEIKWLNKDDPKKSKVIGGNFIPTYARDEETGRHTVRLNTDMLAIYESGYSLIDWDQRQSLGNNSLAKWIHSFYATHAQPFPYKVETLKTLSGSEAGRLSKFREMLRSALDQVLGTGAIESWSIDKNDLVHIVKDSKNGRGLMPVRIK